MSSRKRPLAEISQARSTPSRYAPSTPHALRALQVQLQRSENRTRPRSARSDRSIVRPDSARGILRRLAKVTAPTTKRRVVTPVVRKYSLEKENVPPEEEDEGELEKPRGNFPIEDSIEEEDSEILPAPTPSVLPEDEDEADFSGQDDQPTETFQNLRSLQNAAKRASIFPPQVLMSEPDLRDADDEDVNENDETTFLSERGRRAATEEATGRLSRYSFGSIRFSDFGSELEIRRNSDLLAQGPDADMTLDKSKLFQGDDALLDLGQETEDLRDFPHSILAEVQADDSFQAPNLGDESFELDVQDMTEAAALEQTHRLPQPTNVEQVEVLDKEDSRAQELDNTKKASPRPNRRETLLENAVATARSKPRKRLKMTRHGNVIPSLPSSLIKRIIQQSAELAGKRKPVLGKDHMKALEQATEWFFEQLGDDLATYSSHGKRKKRISEEDVLLLMRRQRVVSGDGDLAQLASDWLPKDTVKELDLPDKL